MIMEIINTGRKVIRVKFDSMGQEHKEGNEEEIYTSIIQNIVIYEMGHDKKEQEQVDDDRN